MLQYSKKFTAVLVVLVPTSWEACKDSAYSFNYETKDPREIRMLIAFLGYIQDIITLLFKAPEPTTKSFFLTKKKKVHSSWMLFKKKKLVWYLYINSAMSLYCGLNISHYLHSSRTWLEPVIHIGWLALHHEIRYLCQWKSHPTRWY